MRGFNDHFIHYNKDDHPQRTLKKLAPFEFYSQLVKHFTCTSSSTYYIWMATAVLVKSTCDRPAVSNNLFSSKHIRQFFSRANPYLDNITLLSYESHAYAFIGS